MSSRGFNQDTSGAKKAAESVPVFFTDRGLPAQVLMTVESYEELLGTRHVLDRLAEPTGVEDVEFVVPVSEEVPQPATFR